MNTLSVVFFAIVGLCQACQLPPPGPDIDWTKMQRQRWYGILSGGSSFDQDYGCAILTIEEAYPGGAHMTMSLTKINGEVHIVPFNATKTSDGYYEEIFVPDSKSSDDLANEVLKTHMGRHQGNDIHMEKIAFYTDYEHYFLFMACGEDGHMDFWYDGPNRDPSIEDILRVTNILGEIGGDWSGLQLYLDRCVTK